MDVEFPVLDIDPPRRGERAKPTLEQRTVAAIEVLLCSDYPTQLLLGAAFAAFGFRPQTPGGGLDIRFVVALSLGDSVFLVALMVIFLLAHGERPRDVFLGRRAILGEMRAGVPMTFTAFAIAVVVLLAARAFAPWLHTVEHNPLQELIRTPRNAALFAVVVVVAGGVREELQRAFLLHRFERWLGGPGTGVIVTSLAFGAGHLMQGADAAVATGLLGAFWALSYLKRRSAVAQMVSHSGFDLLQLVQSMAVGR